MFFVGIYFSLSWKPSSSFWGEEETRTGNCRHHNPMENRFLKQEWFSVLLICLPSFHVKINVKCTLRTWRNCQSQCWQHFHKAIAASASEKHMQLLYGELCPEWMPIYMFYEWKGSVRYCQCIYGATSSRNGNKIYVANNKLMKRNKSLSGSARNTKVQQITLFRSNVLWKNKNWEKGGKRRIIHISNRIKRVFPFRAKKKLCWAKHI